MLRCLPTLLLASTPTEVLTRAAEHHDWWTFAGALLALALVNLGIITALRAGLRRRFPVFRRGVAARVLAWLVAIVEGVALAVAGGVPLERALTMTVIATAAASGGRSWKWKRKSGPRRPAEVVAVPPEKEAAP